MAAQLEADAPGGAPAAPPAPSEGEGKTYTVTDARSAGDAIAGLLFDAGDAEPPPAAKPGADERSGGEEPPDTGQVREPATGDETTEGQGEQPGTAAIEPPRSWTTEEQAEFGKLPPSLQQTITRRESQREAVLTQRSQEAAEFRRAADAERLAAVGLRQEYLAGLQKMMALALPETMALNNIDWVSVQAQSPAEYTRLQALRDATKARLGAIEGEFQQQQAQLAQMQQQQLHALVAQEHQALNRVMPDFADVTVGGKGDNLRRELGVYLRDVGQFTPHEINTAYDHRLVVMGVKAMLYDKQQRNAAAADAKRNNPAAQVQRPGTSQDNDRGPTTRLDRAVQRLGRSNSVRDAGSLIAELLT
jgi:hypothetical protein